MTLRGKHGPSENGLGENGSSENDVTLRGKHGPSENGLGENVRVKRCDSERETWLGRTFSWAAGQIPVRTGNG